jgi:hypothetical protein
MMRTSAFRRVLRLASVAGFAGLMSTAAMAAEGLVLMVGPADGTHAEITFSPDKASDRAIVISTHLVGVTGSRLALNVDRSANPAYEHIMADGECKFVSDASQCEIAISGSAPEYATLVALFKRGLVVHIEVETAGAMQMSQDATLRGFTKAYKGL